MSRFTLRRDASPLKRYPSTGKRTVIAGSVRRSPAMKDHSIATIAAALLLTATSYAGAESIAPSPRSQDAARFADDFARLQALSSNSSAFMQHPGNAARSTANKAAAPAARRMAAAPAAKPERS